MNKYIWEEGDVEFLDESIEKLNLFLKQQPPRSGLVPKKVEVHTEHGVFPAIRWMRPYHQKWPEEMENIAREIEKDLEEKETIEEFVALYSGKDDISVRREIEHLDVSIHRSKFDLEWATEKIVRAKGKDLSDYQKEALRHYQEDADRQKKVIRRMTFEKFLLENELNSPERKEKVRKIYEELASNTSDDEKELTTSPKKGKVNLGGGVNVTHVVVTENGKRLVFKPQSGEQIVFSSGWGGGTSEYVREIAAYQLAKELGLTDKTGRVLVPKTVVKIVDDEIGSAQEYIDKAMPLLVWRRRYSDKLLQHSEQIADATCFDFIIGSADRHHENVLLDENGNIFLIDNGRSLAAKSTMTIEGTELRTYVVGMKLSTKHKQMIDRVLNDPKIKDMVMRLFGNILVYEGMQYRAKNLLKKGHL